jgi:opacity protein-like surface antigen
MNIMKKLVLLITAVCLLSAGNAQTQLEKGRLLAGVTSTIGLGGYHGSELMSLRFMKTKYPGEEGSSTTSGFNFLPRGGYFVMDNLAAGLDILLGLSSQKSSESDYKSSNFGFGIGPFARYYYPLENCWPFAEANFMVGAETSKYSGGTWDDKSKWSFVSFALGVGAAKPIGESVTVDLMAGYSFTLWKDSEPNEEYSGKEICSGIIIKAGFTVLFGL